MDPVKRATLFIRMNDLVIAKVVVIRVLWRNGVGAAGARAPAGHGAQRLGHDHVAAAVLVQDLTPRDRGR